MAKFLPFLFFLLLIPTVGAVTTYDIAVEGNSVLVNATFELYSSSPKEKVNYWTTTFSMLPGSQLLGVSDSKGEITNYTVSEGKIRIETHKGGLKDREVVSLLYRSQGLVNKEYLPLKKLNLSLSAFGDTRPDVPDEKTFVSVQLDGKLISFINSLGFSSQPAKQEIKFAGDGPVAFTLFYGDGKDYKHYTLFGRGNLTAADEAFGIIPAVTGMLPESDRLPVVVLSKNEYNKRINEWSAGEYRGGVIVMDQSGKDFSSSLLHETAHGINERALRWKQSEESWFDEGVAKYVEFLYTLETGARQPEIFGEDVTWTEGFTIYTLPSRSTSEELWDYYQSGEDFMGTWRPNNPGTREFGYAFSELVVRDFILRKGDDALHGIFEELLAVTETTETAEESNAVLLELLDSDFRPCYSSQKEALEECLEQINSMEPNVPESVVIKGVAEKITIPEILPPEEEQFHITLWNNIVEFFNSLFSGLSELFG